MTMMTAWYIDFGTGDFSLQEVPEPGEVPRQGVRLGKAPV